MTTRRYMVIERFKPGCFAAVYERFESKGRMLPDGLVYVDSWVSEKHNVCYQLMETANAELFDPWIAAWSDLTDFEIVLID